MLAMKAKSGHSPLLSLTHPPPPLSLSLSLPPSRPSLPHSSPSLSPPYSSETAVQVCSLLKQVAEEVTQYGDDLKTGPKRELVTALLDTLPAVLQFLCQALSGSYQAASQAAAEGRQEVANMHVAVLKAALGAPVMPGSALHPCTGQENRTRKQDTNFACMELSTVWHVA